MRSPDSFIRPLVRRLHPYVPGEQPRVPGLVKLNTNENPYPPSPRVLEAVRAAADARLRLYPNPTAQALRLRLARLHQCEAANVFVGNGSDECLALAVRAFVEPAGSVRRGSKPDRRSLVQYFTPSYSLYPVLADAHGARRTPVPLPADFSLPTTSDIRRGGLWRFDAALTFVTTPNAPSGRGYRTRDLAELCRRQRGIVVLDEAYADFAVEHALDLALSLPHVLVARTFSKGYSLCFQRVGYLIGHPLLISALDAIRDSYNVNGLGQVAALATLGDLAYYRANVRRIVSTRERLARQLASLGFDVFPSQTNFVLVRPPRFSAEEWRDRLRAAKILVRWFSAKDTKDYLRITVGTEAETARLVRAIGGILGKSNDELKSPRGKPVRRRFRPSDAAS
jgi:histidinol-phosphate aminotransferase